MRHKVIFCLIGGFLFLFLYSSCSKKPTSWEAASPGKLISPVEDTVHTDRPTFLWHKGDGSDYMIEVDDRNTFITPVITDSIINDTVWVPQQPLPDGLLYWRVRSKRSGEPWGKWSDSTWFYIDTNPFVEVSWVELPGYAHDLYIEGDILYVANGEAGLTIVSLSNPETPLVLSNWDDPSLEDYARGVWKSPGDTLVYIADTDGGIIVVNVKDPSNPVYVSAGGDYNTMDVVGVTYDSQTLVFATREDEGVQVYDATYPMALQYQGTRPITGYARGLFIKDDVLYVAQGQAGIAFFDISNPDSILETEMFTFDFPGDARNLFIDDRHIAYVAVKEEGLALLDLMSMIPQLITVLDFNGYVWDAVARNDTAFLAAGGDGFQAVDCLSPDSPTVIGGINSDYIYSIALYGEFVIAGGRRSIHIIKRRW